MTTLIISCAVKNGYFARPVVADGASLPLDSMKTITQFCANTKSFQIAHKYLVEIYDSDSHLCSEKWLLCLLGVPPGLLSISTSQPYEDHNSILREYKVISD